MLIKVMYQNNEIEIIEACQLDTLISSNKIKKFLRSEGWVTVGMDPIRKKSRVNSKASERRQAVKKAANGQRINMFLKGAF
jgi:hypothetical protein